MYQNYNDYELLYLIKDSNPKALNMLFRKYDVLIKTVASEMYTHDSRLYDLIQEGRMLLYECIYKYDDTREISFFSYFLICLKRKFRRELTRDYYSNCCTLRDNMSYEESDLYSRITLSTYKREYKNDKLALLILEENIIREVSIYQLSIDYKISYYKLVNKKKEIIETLKKIID